MPEITPAAFEHDSSQMTSEMGRTPTDAIDLQPGLKRQFYYPLILLVALNRTPGLERRVQSGASPPAKQNSTEIFHDFVNRVALLCQTRTGGDAVSACAVLSHPSGIKYLFTSNSRNHLQLGTVAAALTAILNMVSRRNDGDRDNSLKLHQKILLKILSLVKPRIKCYLNSLGQHLQNCIVDCERGNHPKDETLRQELRELGNLADVARDLTGPGRDTDGLFPEATRKVLERISSIRLSDSLSNLLVDHTLREERRGGDPHWREARHILDRLAAYGEAVDSFFKAQRLWPELFDEFQVQFIPSSPAKTGFLSTARAQTSQVIVGKITSKEKDLARLKKQASEMQLKHNIDEQIAEEWPSRSRFIVHAEIRLHRWLETSEGGTLPDRFFGGYKYIGSSKPTCRLCHYYFKLHGTDVQVRPSHQNIYTNWRLHDVFLGEIPISQRGGNMERHFRGQDENAARERMLLLRKIKDLIVSDIKRILNDKLSDRRDHDSTDKNTMDMIIHRPVSTVGSLSATFDNLSVVGEVDDSPDNTTAVSLTSSLGNSGHGSGSQPDNGLAGPDSVARARRAMCEIDDTPDGDCPRASIEPLRGAYSWRGRQPEARRYAPGGPSSLTWSRNVDAAEDDSSPVIVFRGRRGRGGTTSRGRGGPISKGRGQ